MTKSAPYRRRLCAVIIAVALAASGCGWRGLNSLALPGTKGGGPGSYTVKAQLPDVGTLERNSRVRVGDVTVGNVTDIERQGWHALVTMTIDGHVALPANATAAVGQTSLLGSLHVELAPPTATAPQGKLHDGSLIPLSSGSMYPSTEQALSAVSMIFNGGGVGQIQDITQSLSTAFAGRERDMRDMVSQLDKFTRNIADQTPEIIKASTSFNNLIGQFADQKPVVDKAIKTIPDALAELKDERQTLADAADRFGKFSALVASETMQTKQSLVTELKDLGPVLQSLADAGPALTRSLNFYATYPFPKDSLTKWLRGDYANLTAIVDLTLSRLDAGLFTGTRWEGNLTELEMQWGRTVGQMPSPYTAGNPLVAPYHWDQGP
jgi:phospholipid/cholesterol/gamma-HCH transport system substrate-binding protein